MLPQISIMYRGMLYLSEFIYVTQPRAVLRLMLGAISANVAH
jgi:hypothetical protein